MKKHKYLLVIPESIWQKAKIRAVKERKTLADVIRDFLKKYGDNHETDKNRN